MKIRLNHCDSSICIQSYTVVHKAMQPALRQIFRQAPASARHEGRTLSPSAPHSAAPTARPPRGGARSPSAPHSVAPTARPPRGGARSPSAPLLTLLASRPGVEFAGSPSMQRASRGSDGDKNRHESTSIDWNRPNSRRRRSISVDSRRFASSTVWRPESSHEVPISQTLTITDATAFSTVVVTAIEKSLQTDSHTPILPHFHTPARPRFKKRSPDRVNAIMGKVNARPRPEVH